MAAGSVPLNSCPVTTAEHRPKRAPRALEDDRVQAGLLAYGSQPSSAFPSLASQGPVATWRRTHRLQLRGQLRIEPAL